MFLVFISGWSNVLALNELVDDYECLNGHPVSECESLGCEYVQKRKDAETETHRGSLISVILA